MRKLSGSFTVQIDVIRLGREVAARVVDALTAAGSGDQLAEQPAGKVAEQVNDEFAPFHRPGLGTTCRPAGVVGLLLAQ